MKKMLRVLVNCMMALVLCATTLAQPITDEQKREVLTDIEKVLNDRAFVPGIDLKDWQPRLDKHKEAIDKAKTNDEFVRAVNAALREFGISHLRLRTPVQAQRREQTSMVGVGISSRDGENVLHVLDVVPNSPAAEAGIQPGDLIVAIDGKAPDAPGELAGEENSKVDLKIKRGDTERDISLVRKRFSTLRPDTLTWIDEQTAVLKIHTFSNGYSRQRIDDLMEQAAKAKYLLLDLRSNGGGATTNLRHLLTHLLPPETAVGTFVGKQAVKKWTDDGNTDTSDVAGIASNWPRKYATSRRDSPSFSGKVAVLVNRGSASASEICAAAMRECAGAILVGTKTAGAVLSSTFAPMANKFQLQYPSQDYVTIKGMRLEKHPLDPDIEEGGAARDGKDPVAERAVRALREAAPAEPARPEIKTEPIPMKDARGMRFPVHVAA